MHRVWTLLTACLLLAGCGSPSVVDSTTPSAAVDKPTEPTAVCRPLAVDVRTDSGVTISGVRPQGEVPFAWSSDGLRLAFQHQEGIGVVDADGANGALLPNSQQGSILLGWWRDEILFLQMEAERTSLVLGAQDCTDRVVALFQPEGPPDLRDLVAAGLQADTVVLVRRGPAVTAINLQTGLTRELPADLALPLSQQIKLSSDGRYLATKLHNRADPVTLIDLATGMEHTAPGEMHLGQVVWAPAEPQWAVRAASPDSGLPVTVGANYVDGASHLVLGTADGQRRELHPPEPLTLVDGPYWAPDGQSIAVAAGIARGSLPDQPAEFRATAVWLINLKDGTWREVGALPESALTSGGLPDALSQWGWPQSPYQRAVIQYGDPPGLLIKRPE